MGGDVRKFNYGIINREGNIVFSSPHLLSVIGASGLCLIKDDNSPSIYSVNTHRERPLPTHIGGKEVVYRVDWNYPIEDAIVGYIVEKKNSLRQPNLLPQESTPAGMRGIASVVLDAEFQPLFDPMPLYIYPYKGKWTLARNYNKRLFLLDHQGNKLRGFPNNWRLNNPRYDETGNLSEFVVCKCADKKEYHPPLYHYDIQTDSLRGPYREIGRIKEGIRHIMDMDSNIYFVDKEWNTLFTCCQLQKKSPFYILSECFQGHIAFFSSMRAGLLNKQGEVVMKPAYSEIYPIGDSLWWYKKKGCYGIIHESGEIITNPQYMISWFKYFSHGLVAASNKRDRSGYIDHKGRWVIKPSFEACYTFIHPHYAIAKF